MTNSLNVVAKTFSNILIFLLLCIAKTCLYNFDPLKPQFYYIKVRVDIIFLISAQKHRLWVLIRTASVRQF